jgi:transcriptional regulator with XRE-family HTH domain
MAKLLFDKNGLAKGQRDISVVDLPTDLIIDNPRFYLEEMRANFLKLARKAKGFSEHDASKKCGINIEEYKRIESGKVKEQDMMILHDLSILYGLDYYDLLFLFKLAGRSERKQEKLAAYHNQEIDSKTQKELTDFLTKLKDYLP